MRAPLCPRVQDHQPGTARQARKLRGMERYFLRKANDAAADDSPWALGNLRTYQDWFSKMLAERLHNIRAYLARRKERA